MPTLTHNKDAVQEQKHEANAEALKDKSAGHDKLNHGAVAQTERAVELQMRARETLQDVLGSAFDLSKEFNESLNWTAPHFQEPVDTFGPAGPGGAAQRMGEELQRSQREALEQSQANEWGRHFDQVRDSLLAAAQSVVAAEESMLARHEATRSTFRDELMKELAHAGNRDQSAGNMTASELLSQQQQREQEVADRLETLVQRQIAELDRLRSFGSDMRKAILDFANSVRADASENAGRSSGQRLQDAQDHLQEFDEKWRDMAALRNLWDGRFSDLEAVKRTWERAAARPAEELNKKWDKLDEEGRREEAGKAYDAARRKFWGLVNEQKDDDAREVHRLLDKLRVEWQQGNSAPLLHVPSARLEQAREAAAHGDKQMQESVESYERSVRITIDHVDDKGMHPQSALDVRNLRFLTNDDNSARGNKRDLTDNVKLDFGRTKEELAANQERRDYAAGKRAEESRETVNKTEIALAGQRLKQEQDRAAAQHQKVVNEAVETRDKKVDELRTGELRLLSGEDENLRRARQDTRLDDLNKFLNAALKQSEQLQQVERSMHERQQQMFSQVLERLAGGPAMMATQVLKELQKLELRFAEDQSKFENLWRDMDTQRNLDELRMLHAIYEAASREVQEANIKRALERQQQTQQDQDRRLADLDRERQAHE